MIILGALAVDRLERIIIDASHIDVKKRGILEMKETQVPLILWLGQAEFKERYAAAKDGIQLLFF
jgi:protein CMS1